MPAANQAFVFDAHGRSYAIELRRTPALFSLLSKQLDERTDDDFDKIIERIEVDGDEYAFADLGSVDYAIVIGAIPSFLSTCVRVNFGAGLNSSKTGK